jgi:hypothetical protein
MPKRAYWFGVGGVALIVPLVGMLHSGCQGTCDTDTDCPSGTFCFIGPTDCATSPVPEGFCTDISEICSPAAVPVCGCNNETFLNACAASQHGQATANMMGACVALPCGTSSDDCPKGQVCEFPAIGTCPGQGVIGSCETPMVKCTDAFEPVCGCDGKTYDNQCEMERAGVSELSPGGCSCQNNGQCASDQFCAFTIAGAVNPGACLMTDPVGNCAPIPTSCSQVQAMPVCGCDGNTYDNGCIASQSGVNVAFAGACPSGVLPDGGTDGG